MSIVHRNSTFKNACIKMPIHPRSRRPVPRFERPTIVIEDTDGEMVLQKKNKNNNSSSSKKKCKKKHSNKTAGGGGHSTDCPQKNVTHLVDFIESIPDYKDVNHLSKVEFYGKLDLLKQKQAELNSACFAAGHKQDRPEDEQRSSERSSRDQGKIYNRSKSASPFRSTPLLLTKPKPFQMTLRDEEKGMLHDALMMNRSAFTDPVKRKESPTPLKPSAIPVSSKYPMYKEIMLAQEKRSQLAKLNSAIELQSKIQPFSFDTSNKFTAPPHEELLAIASNNHNHHQHHHHHHNTGEHQLNENNDTHDGQDHCFRAKPCPKNLFSNYFYHKMWEEQYFRALNRKLRAEELLKISTLPPSMRRRELQGERVRSVEPSGDADADGDGISTQLETPRTTTTPTQTIRTASAMSMKGAGNRQRSRRRVSSAGGKNKMDYCHLTSKVNAKTDDEFITTCPRPFEFETEKRSTNRKSKKNCSSASTVSSSKAATIGGTSVGTATPSPMPMYPAARPNLAANLRVEWAQKKLCELSVGPQKTFPKEKLPRSSWGVRKSAAWKSLYYDNTNDEDISLRLATRRAEQKLRQEEHHINMELMRQRVRAAPLLLEGQTQWATSMDALRHSCTTTPANLVRSSSGDRPKHQRKHTPSLRRRNCSKLSNYSNYSGCIDSNKTDVRNNYNCNEFAVDLSDSAEKNIYGGE